MGAQTKTVGGGTATGAAGDWNSFLRQQLTGQSPQQQGAGDMLGGMQQAMQNVPPWMQGQMQQQMNNAAQPYQQTLAGTNGAQQAANGIAPQAGIGVNSTMMNSGGGFQGAFNNQLNGGVPDPSGAGAGIQGLIQNGPQSGQNFQNPYSAPQFQQANIAQHTQNPMAGNGMMDMGQFGREGPTNQNVMQGFGSQANLSANPQIQQMMQQLQGFNASGGGGVSSTATSLAPGMDYRGAYDTLGQDPLADRNRMMAVADQRARFGAEGAGALGSGAQVAEGNLNAQFIAQDASNRRGQAMQLMGQDLNERMGGANVGLQSAGQSLQAGIASAGNQMQGLGMNLNALNSAGQLGLGMNSQALQNQTANRGMDINQLGLGLNQAQGNQNAGIQQRGQDISGGLQNQAQGNQFGYQQAGLNQAGTQYDNANSMNMAGTQNNFNQNNANSSAQYGLGTNQLNQQGQQNGMQQFLQALGMGQQGNQFGAGMQGDMLRNLFGAFGQSNALGTPQAQMIQQPSGWGQLANAGMQLGAAYLGGGGGFGGGGGGAPTPSGGGSYRLPNNIGSTPYNGYNTGLEYR